MAGTKHYLLWSCCLPETGSRWQCTWKIWARLSIYRFWPESEALSVSQIAKEPQCRHPFTGSKLAYHRGCPMSEHIGWLKHIPDDLRVTQVLGDHSKLFPREVLTQFPMWIAWQAAQCRRRSDRHDQDGLLQPPCAQIHTYFQSLHPSDLSLICIGVIKNMFLTCSCCFGDPQVCSSFDRLPQGSPTWAMLQLQTCISNYLSALHTEPLFRHQPWVMLLDLVLTWHEHCT